MQVEAKPKLLLVDDDTVFVQVLGRALRARGLEVTSASSADGTRRSLQGDQFAYAVLDLRLGEDNGLTLIPELVAHSPDIRILLLTGYASIATAVHAIKLGAHNYLPKPVDADSVLQALSGARHGNSDIPPPPPAAPLRRLEWEYIQRMLVDCSGNISEAARRLGMHRRTLQRKLDKHPVRERS